MSVLKPIAATFMALFCGFNFYGCQNQILFWDGVERFMCVDTEVKNTLPVTCTTRT